MLSLILSASQSLSLDGLDYMFPKTKKHSVPPQGTRKKFKVTRKPKDDTLDIDKLLSEFKFSQLKSTMDDGEPSTPVSPKGGPPPPPSRGNESISSSSPSLLLSNLKTIGNDFEKLLGFGKLASIYYDSKVWY